MKNQVTYENEDTVFSSILCQPNQPGKFPAIITIHGIYGLQEMDVNFAEELSSQGYVVLAHGWQSKEKDPSDESIIAGIEQAIHFLKKNYQVEPDRIGLVGVCRGGSIAMLAAAHILELKTCVSFYGQAYYPYLDARKPSSPIDLVNQIQIPMLLIHGKEDMIFDYQESIDFCSALTARGMTCEYKLYPGAGHGFFLKGHRNYHQQASEDAWDVLTDFLTKNV